MCETILERLYKLFDKRNILSAIHYGNLEGNDIDILVIVKSDIYYDRIENEDLDLTVVGIKYLEYLLSVFDPIVVEPFLTGKTVCGENFLQAKEYLLNISSNKQTVEHHMNFANEIYKTVDVYINCNKLKYAIANIVFCLSYIRFAQYYSTSKKVITFKKLIKLNQDSLLIDTYQHMKSNKYDLNQILKYSHKTKSILCEKIDKIL